MVVIPDYFPLIAQVEYSYPSRVVRLLAILCVFLGCAVLRADKNPCAVRAELLATRYILPERLVAITKRTYVIWKEKIPQTVPVDHIEVQVFDRKTHMYLGHMYVRIDDDGHAAAPIYFKKKGKGYGTESKFAVMKHLFDNWNVRVMTARISQDNVASQNLHEKLGFKRVPTNDPTIYLYIIYRDDFAAIRPELELLASDPILN